jgi:hypothetical protein
MMYPAHGCYGPSLQDQGIGPEDCEPEIPVLVKTELQLWADFLDKDGHSENGSCPEARWAKRMTLKEFGEFMDAVNDLVKRWSRDPYDFGNMWVLRTLKILEESCQNPKR